MPFQAPSYWLGDEQSFINFMLQHEQMPSDVWLQARNNELFGRSWGEEEEPEPKAPISMEDRMALELIEVYDSVAVLSIHGHLVDDESPLNKWFGDVGYPTIARAAALLAADEGISHVVTSFSTGGGSASGVGEASDALDQLRKIKPVMAWTGSSALSAGQWLMASSDRAYATKMAEVGSIGAISAFNSVKRMMQERGIDSYIARSTPKKAKPHPLEEIDAEGKKVLDDGVEAMHGFFIDHLVSHRPALSSEGSKESWASGEVFFAQKGIEMGLIDGPPKTISELVQELNAAHQTSQETGGYEMPKHVVLSTEQDRARLGAGAPLTDLGANTPEHPLPSAAELAAGAAGAGGGGSPEGGDGTGGGGGSPEGGDGTGGGGGPAPVEANVAAGDGLSTYLQTEIAELKESVKTLQTELAEANAKVVKLDAATAALAALRPAVETAVQRLQVALGQRPVELKDFPDATLGEMFTNLNAELMAFPTGQHSVEGASPRADADETVDTSLAEQRLYVVPKRS